MRPCNTQSSGHATHHPRPARPPGPTGRRTSGNIRALALAAPLLAAVHSPAQPPAETTLAQRTIEAYNAVESWIRAWEVPLDPPPLDLESVSGACVTLRLGGAVVGRGAEMQPRGGNALHAAAMRAWLEARQRAPVERDALRRQRLLDLAPRITIDVQISAELTPLLGDTYAQAVDDLSPGVHGVAARVGARVEPVFPGAMLSSNMTPAEGLMAAVGAFNLPPLELGQLRRDHGLVVYRFDVRHIAQPAPGEPPVFLYRGGRVRPLSAVSLDSLRGFGADLARHILSRKWPGPEHFGLLDTYRPWVGDYAEPLVAGPREQALAALALARWTRTLRSEPADATDILRQALDILAAVAQHTGPEQPPLDDPVACALFALAAHEARDRTADLVAAARTDAAMLVVERLSEALAPVRAFAESECLPRVAAVVESEESFEATPAPAAAVLVCAYARAAAADARTAQADRARAADAVRSLFRRTPATQFAGVLPWLGWAELALLDESEPVPAAAALRTFRDLLWRHQIPAGDASKPPDLAGGVVFTDSRNPLPTAQTARPVIFIAGMIADPRLTDADERPGQVTSLMASLRFLMQLSVGPDEMHMFQGEDRALGGVRAAPWDQRLPLDASAAALLAVAETLLAADRLNGH